MANYINIGSSNNNDSKVINIGGINDTINIYWHIYEYISWKRMMDQVSFANLDTMVFKVYHRCPFLVCVDNVWQFFVTTLLQGCISLLCLFDRIVMICAHMFLCPSWTWY